jgi:fibronectin type 3 domain-containing protein
MVRATFVIVVLAVACGGSSPSKPAAPAAPTGLTAVGGAGKISLTWAASQGATSYNVLRGDAAGAEANPVAAAQTSYDDTGLPPGKTYFYVVQAVNAAGTSGNSSEASATTLAPPPAPTGLSVTAADTTAVVQWTAVPTATGYTILRNGTAVGNAAGTSFSDTGLTPNTTYTYVVRATNAAGTSPDATVSATTAPQPPTALAVTATSNHHVSLTWTAPANAGTGGYRILRGASASGPFASAGTSTSTSFTDTQLVNGTSYSYVVHTIGGSGESGNSNVASATPFIEICTTDSASYRVNVHDGTGQGNLAPKRSFGWDTTLAGASGIGVDGSSNVWIASRYTNSIGIWSRTGATRNVHPDVATIALSGQPTALFVDAANNLAYVAIGGTVQQYSTVSHGALNSLATGIQEPITALALDAGHGVLFVVHGNTITTFAGTDCTNSGCPAPTRADFTVSATTAADPLVAAAYDSINDALWVGWLDKFASYSRATGALLAGPFSDSLDNLHRVGGLYVDTAFVASATPAALIVSNVSADGTHDFLGAYTLKSTGSGDTEDTHEVVGSNTQLNGPGPMAFDATNHEYVMVNGAAGALAMSRASLVLSGNKSPVRAPLGGAAAVGFWAPVGVAADRPRDQYVVLGRSASSSLFTFPRSSTGSPSRSTTIAANVPDGSGGTLSIDVKRVAVDEQRQDYWVAASSGILADYDGTGGSAAPVTALGVGTAFIGTIDGLLFDPAKGQAVIASSFGSTSLLAYDRTSTNSSQPDRNGAIGGSHFFATALDPVHSQIVGVRDSNVEFAPSAFATGAVDPAVGFFIGPADGIAVDGEGDEIYVLVVGASSSRIDVYPRSATGSPTPSRSITGPATNLNVVSSIAICN